MNARTLGRYELLQRLAVGGMAELFLARSRGTGAVAGFEKRLVIKRILPDLANEPEVRALFLDEARLVATLAHPNIVQVFDLGEEDAELFFAMEYVHGVDALRLMRATPKMPLPTEVAIEIVCEAAAGLHYAHEREIVHRDVSPNNLLCTWDGHVKVVDFGIAKAASRSTRYRTRTGTLRGKPVYMSPEQAKGEELDRRSDVFSLAIVLYELTTGVRCFDGDNDYAILHQITSGGFRKPTQVRAEYPAALEDIVRKALAVDRDARFQTAAELAEALDAYARGAGLPRGPTLLAACMEERLGPAPALPTPAPVRAETAPTVPDLDNDVPSAVKRRRSWRVPVAIGIAAAAGITALALASLRETSRAVEQTVVTPTPSAPSPATPPSPSATPPVDPPGPETVSQPAPAKRTTKRADRRSEPASKPSAAPPTKGTRALDLDSALP